MAKKNFDAFINAAGKKPKPTPEEVEAMARQLHQTTSEPAEVVPPPIEKAAPPKPVALKRKPGPAKTVLTRRGAQSARDAGPGDAPREKVRITIDLAKDLYKRMKLAVVQNETEISAYIRILIEQDLSRK